ERVADLTTTGAEEMFVANGRLFGPFVLGRLGVPPGGDGSVTFLEAGSDRQAAGWYQAVVVQAARNDSVVIYFDVDPVAIACCTRLGRIEQRLRGEVGLLAPPE